MKIHSDKLTWRDFSDAMHKAGAVDIAELEQAGSRSRKRAFRFYLTGSSCHRGNSGNYGARTDTYAATWDEWGIFLAHLFEVDPNAHTGKHGYLSAEHFHWATGNRFQTLTPLLQHRRHKWWSQGLVVTGSYHVAQCAECEAVQRRMAHGHSFDELTLA